MSGSTIRGKLPGSDGNGLPVARRYAWRGDDGREAEVQAFLAAVRARLAPGPGDVSEAVADRCETCGYLRTWCACPGGPRG